MPRPGLRAWQSTGMARMFRAYRPGDVIGDFSRDAGGLGSRATVVKDGRHFIEIRRGESTGWNRYPVDYVIGSKWQQAYATRLPDARLLVFPIQYSRTAHRVGQLLGHSSMRPARRVPTSRAFTAPADGAIYQTTCAPCHTSQLSFAKGAVEAGGGHVPRRGHQLRDVPWPVAGSHRAR